MSWFKELEIPEELFKIANEDFGMNWASPKIKIKFLNWGELGEVQNAAISIKGRSEDDMSASVNSSEFQLQLVLKSVVEAPWIVKDVGAVKGLPPFIGQWLHKEIEKLNKVEKKKSGN